MKRPVIEVRNLTYRIDGAVILDGVTVDVFEGEYLSIIGPNGAGKTTLLRCLMRIYRAPAGTVRVMGCPAERLGQRRLARLVSYVPQGEGRITPFTVGEFVMMGRYPYGGPFSTVQAEDRRAVRDALALAGIEHLAGRRMDTLSGGERQTASIAASIVQGSGILLLDEPTTFLDPKHEADIRSILRRLNRERGRTIVSVTHDINAAALESDRIVILKDGAVLRVGEAHEVMDNAVLSAAYGKTFSFVEHPATGSRIVVPDVGGR